VSATEKRVSASAIQDLQEHLVNDLLAQVIALDTVFAELFARLLWVLSLVVLSLDKVET
jgi:hypothetical protein